MFYLPNRSAYVIYGLCYIHSFNQKFNLNEYAIVVLKFNLLFTIYFSITIRWLIQTGKQVHGSTFARSIMAQKCRYFILVKFNTQSLKRMILASLINFMHFVYFNTRLHMLTI